MKSYGGGTEKGRQIKRVCIVFRVLSKKSPGVNKVTHHACKVPVHRYIRVSLLSAVETVPS